MKIQNQNNRTKFKIKILKHNKELYFHNPETEIRENVENSIGSFPTKWIKLPIC